MNRNLLKNAEARIAERRITDVLIKIKMFDTAIGILYQIICIVIIP